MFLTHPVTWVLLHLPAEVSFVSDTHLPLAAWKETGRGEKFLLKVIAALITTLLYSVPSALIFTSYVQHLQVTFYDE